MNPFVATARRGVCAACIAVVTIAAAGGAAAQSFWRCGAEGRIYTDQPCDAGQPARQIALADTRSPVLVTQGQTVAERERKLAGDLTRERLQREREYRRLGSGLAGIKPAVPERVVPAARQPLPKAPRQSKQRQRGSAGETSPTAGRASRGGRG